MLSVVIGQRIPGQSGVTLLARLRGVAGQLLTQASLVAITYVVSDLTNGKQLANGSFAIAGTIFDALQTDPRWTKDSQAQPGPDGSWGYNFLAVIPAATIGATPLSNNPPSPRRVQVDVVFQPVSGEPFRAIFTWVEAQVYG
jgi:hypothetical protein